jgi:glycerol kinase
VSDAPYVLALDQGTTSSRALLFDPTGAVVAQGQHEFPQYFPQPGWVEHDPIEIWDSQLRAARGALASAGAAAGDLAAIGITNQRETALIWERASGRPIYPAIVWQSRQTAAICEALRERGLSEWVQKKTGLVIDAYFSATKFRFILDAVAGAQRRAESGELACGTVDTWLLHQLTRGAVHATEASNASRTMLWNLHSGQWDAELLGALDLPAAMLPEVRDSSGVFGSADPEWCGGPIPIAGVAGDQQAALFGQGCFAPGQAKNTYGTGCFFLLNTGERPQRSANGLLTTVAWKLGGQLTYAIEGSVFVAGAAIQWLRDGLGLLRDVSESEACARAVEDTGGVVLVPAFVGLGAPHWDEAARGAIVGITRGTTREHLVRAALESLAFQSADVIDAAVADSGSELETLRVDGGASRNDFLMQFLGVGLWSSLEELKTLTSQRVDRFSPTMDAARRASARTTWSRALERAKAWAAP